MKRIASIVGLVLVAGAPAIASAAPGDDGVLRGRIQNASPYNLDLQRGPHINLRNGTVIDPRGTTLRPGMRVLVFGHYEGNRRNFLADRIRIEHGRGNHGDWDRNDRGNGNRNDWNRNNNNRNDWNYNR